MRPLLALAALLLLAACEPTEEQRQSIQQTLPPGCTFRDVGRYGEFDRLVFIMCDGRRSTSLNAHRDYQCGKSRCSVRTAAMAVMKGNTQ